MAHWDKRLRAWLGHGLPENYLTFDYETTGTNVKEDLALDFGFCVVRNKKVVKQQGFVLDWTQRPEWVDPEWLREKLEKLIYIFSMKKKPWVYTWDYLREHGRDPLKVLEFNLQLFQANRNVGALFVGHNAFKFDSPLFQNMSAEYLGETWWFEPDELFDTGCMEKASRSRELNNPRMWLTPRAGESMADFFHRVHSARLAGVYWNIESVVERYELGRLYGITPDKLHGAAIDSYVCHLLVELQRQPAEAIA